MFQNRCRQGRRYLNGMLCFASEYEVRTRKGGIESNFVVETSSGKDPFRIARQESHPASGNGTALRATVDRSLPSAEHVATVLSARFLHDPQFSVSVNGRSIPLANHQGLVIEKTLSPYTHSWIKSGGPSH
jgi:hypothetical protein